MLGIIGGGLSGISLGYFVKDSEILESDSKFGGLMQSIQENGFTFDISGGHILFSQNEKVLDFIKNILGDNIVSRKRNTKILYNDRYIKYPFENGLSELPLKENYECLRDFINCSHKSPKNFKEFLYNNFGKSIANKYLIPYNKKIWKYPLNKMEAQWAKDRLPIPKTNEVIKASLGLESEGYTHQLNFFYPKDGGIQSLINKLAEKTKIINNFKVEKIERNGNGWLINKEKYYDDIVSTIPLPELIKCLDNVPQRVLRAVNNLKYNSLITIMLGLNFKIKDISWIYFAGNELYHRLNFVSNFSENAAPKGKSSLIAEITYRKDNKIVTMTDQEIINVVISQFGCHKLEICYSKVYKTKYAYVIYDINYYKNMQIINSFLEERGIKTIGRFAEWQYYNMDNCIDKAMELSKKLNGEIK